MRIKFTWEYPLAVFFVFVIVMAGCMLYSIAHQGGWYCEYCYQGDIRGRYEVTHTYGSVPCKCSDDSCHHFRYYLAKPEPEPKYVKY